MIGEAQHAGGISRDLSQVAPTDISIAEIFGDYSARWGPIGHQASLKTTDGDFARAKLICAEMKRLIGSSGRVGDGWGPDTASAIVPTILKAPLGI